MWITWVRCVVSSIWTHNISLDYINIVSKLFYDLHGERNVYRSRQGVSPGKAPYKKKKTLESLEKISKIMKIHQT